MWIVTGTKHYSYKFYCTIPGLFWTFDLWIDQLFTVTVLFTILIGKLLSKHPMSLYWSRTWLTDQSEASILREFLWMFIESNLLFLRWVPSSRVKRKSNFLNISVRCLGVYQSPLPSCLYWDWYSVTHAIRQRHCIQNIYSNDPFSWKPHCLLIKHSTVVSHMWSDVRKIHLHEVLKGLKRLY